jgi:hypothetical protein
MISNRIGIGVIAWLAACGGAAAEHNGGKAKAAAYNTDFGTVWNAIVAEMHERYHEEGIMVEDGAQGIIQSKWKSVEAMQDPSFSNVGRNQNLKVAARLMMQIKVTILPGGPPWKVTVEGEAAELRVGMTMLRPLKRGTSDEPQWVPGKIDAVETAIYKRLREYAVAAPPSR